MPRNIIYRQVEPHECTQVVRLHREVFSAEKLKYSIYAAFGVDKYLANLIRFPSLRDDNILWGAWNKEDLIAYAHFRAVTGAWHLNYIAVSPTCQGDGIGRNLWRRWIETGLNRGSRLFSLDVEQDNELAFTWYKRQGLRIVQKHWTYEGSLETESIPVGEMEVPRLLDWEVSEAWHSTYGFSQFRLAYRGKDWSIGRVGTDYFRVHDSLPPALKSVLANIDGERRLLVVSSEIMNGTNAKQIGVTLRMEGALI